MVGLQADDAWVASDMTIQAFARLCGCNPLLISSISATTVALIFRGFDPILSVTLNASDIFIIRQIPLYILLGVCCGLMSYYFTSINSFVGRKIKGIASQYRRWAIAGVMLGVLIFPC